MNEISNFYIKLFYVSSCFLGLICSPSSLTSRLNPSSLDRLTPLEVLWISEVLHASPGPKIGEILPYSFLLGNIVAIWT